MSTIIRRSGLTPTERLFGYLAIAALLGGIGLCVYGIAQSMY